MLHCQFVVIRSPTYLPEETKMRCTQTIVVFYTECNLFDCMQTSALRVRFIMLKFVYYDFTARFVQLKFDYGPRHRYKRYIAI
jgi:hypothetical protein